MTGKEALINIRDTINEMCRKLGYDYAGSLAIDSYQTLKEIVQNHDKYKRAFEILKEVLVIPEDNDIDWYDNDINYYKLRFTNRLIKENEKELLEELMKSEQNQI